PPHEPPRWMRVPVDLLVLACLVVGIVPGLAIGPVLRAAALPVVGGELPPYRLAVWHGFGAPMVMSLIALGGGLAGYLVLRGQWRQDRLQRAPLVHLFEGARLFRITMLGLNRAARAALRLFGTRRLQPQLFLMLGLCVLGAGAALWPG